MKFCISCETDSVVFGKTKIKVGRETFETEAEHCKKCNKVAITPGLQKKIDEWALQFIKSIVELQPYFTSDMHERIATLSHKYNLSKSEFMKACTAFYLLEMTKLSNFKALRTEFLDKAKGKYKGNRDKISIPIKYQLFKKVDLYTRVWKLDYDANVFEEAIAFCVIALDDHSNHIEQIKRQELVHFVESYAMAS